MRQVALMSVSRSVSVCWPVLRSKRPASISLTPSLVYPQPYQSIMSFSTSSRWGYAATTTENTKTYTTDKYPELKRDTRFAKLTTAHVGVFKSILGDSGVIDGVSREADEDLEAFNVDWLNKYRGHTRLVLKPKNVEHVSKVLKYCNEEKLAIVPQAGNSGLVGGSVPVFDEIVVSTSKMDQIRTFDDISGILVADSGCILEVVDKFLAEHGHIFPLDLGAKGSCQIGGNVATNAGGLRLMVVSSVLKPFCLTARLSTISQSCEKTILVTI